MTKREILQELMERIDWPTIHNSALSIMQCAVQADNIDFKNDSDEEIYENFIGALSGVGDFLYDIQHASQQFDYYCDKIGELEEADENKLDYFLI